MLVSAINMPLSLELEDELLECEEIDVCLSLDISQDMEPPGVELEANPNKVSGYVLQTDKEGNLLDVMIDQQYERDDWR